MKKILLITYYFAPCNVAGTLRMLKFVKYLPEFGWTPLVLTCSHQACEFRDEDLIKDVPGEVKTWRCPALGVYTGLQNLVNFLAKFRPARTQAHQFEIADVSDHRMPSYSIADRIFYNLFIPDGMMDWMPLAAAYAHWIIRHYRVEVVLTSSPPHSTHLLGVVLKRYKNVKWIVDFRDPWLDNVVRNRMLSLSPYRNAIEKRMEKWTLRQADGVIANTEANRGILLARHPQLDPKKVVVIPNGFDTADLEQLPEIEAKSEKFVATFTGYLYPGMADAFLRAVAKLLHKEPGLAHKLKIQFIGQASPYYQQKMFSSSNGLFQVTQWLGPMSHRRAIAHLRRSDLLLCFNFPAKEAAGVVPSKLYEYFMMAKPILAVGPEGEAAALIRQARAGQAFAPHQEDEIASAIRHFMRCWENRGLKAELNQEFVQRFDRRLLAQKLAEQCNAYA